MGHSIVFQTFFVWLFKTVIDSWKFSTLLLYILWDDRLISIISGSNEQLQQQLEYTLLKPDCHSWWISKMQSDTLEERYAIKLCFKLGRNATETYGMLQTAFRPTWIEHEFLSGIRDSRKAGNLRGMMRSVRGVRKSIHQSWLAQELGLGIGFLCWGFKGVQEEILSEEASTLEIGSVTFPAGQCTSLQLYPCHRLFDQDEFLSLPVVQTLLPVTFDYSLSCRYETIEEMKEAVTKVIDTLTQEDFHGAFQKLLERYNKCIAARRDYFEGDYSFMCVQSIKVSSIPYISVPAFFPSLKQNFNCISFFITSRLHFWNSPAMTIRL